MYIDIHYTLTTHVLYDRIKVHTKFQAGLFSLSGEGENIYYNPYDSICVNNISNADFSLALRQLCIEAIRQMIHFNKSDKSTS